MRMYQGLIRWSMLQDNVASLVTLGLTASEFVQDNSTFFFFLRHVVVGLATPMSAPMSRVFFFKKKIGAFAAQLSGCWVF